MDAPAEVGFGQLLFGGISFMLLAAIALVGFVVTYQKRLLRQQRQLRAAEAAYQQQLLGAVIEAQERERERIGRDLHDGIGSTIATAKLLINRLAIDRADAGQADLLRGVQEIMGTAVQDVRSISHALFPAVLARFGLAEAIQHLVDVYHETSTRIITFNVSYPHPLPLAQELALYRICQELIHNSIKHAQGATELLVELVEEGAVLQLVVADDGCGFTPDDTSAAITDGAGLHSIGVRAQMLQARITRSTAPGQGLRTVVELDVPAQT
jgi:two-component system, NarL family, sensor kinase